MNLCFSANCNKGVNNARDSWGSTPLIQAAWKNNVDVAKLLLENSANMDSTDADGRTPLHEAAWMNSVGVAKLLLENSANVDSTDNYGETALHRAAWMNSVEVARLLLRYSANLNATAVSGSGKGLTPLQLAERYQRLEMVVLLKFIIPKQATAKDCEYHGDCATTQVKTFF